MAIIEYDTNPALTIDEKMQSLMASIQLALNERDRTDSKAGLGSVASMSKKQLQDAIDVQIKARDQEKYPIGKIEINITGQNPASYLGFGTWVAWGSGRVPVGVDEGDADFDTSEHTGGSKNAVNVTHQHDLGNHTHTLGGHSHSLNSHTHTMNHGHSDTFSVGSGGDHTHKIQRSSAQVNTDGSSTWSHISTSAGSSASGFIDSAGNHTHTLSGSVSNYSGSTGGASGSTGSASGNTGSASGSTGSSGESGVGKNLQPYITCYMFKRTA